MHMEYGDLWLNYSVAVELVPFKPFMKVYREFCSLKQVYWVFFLTTRDGLNVSSLPVHLMSQCLQFIQ